MLADACGLANVASAAYHKKKSGFPHQGTLDEQAAFILSHRKGTGRKSDKEKAALLTSDEVHDNIRRKEELDTLVKLAMLEKRHRKILEIHNDKLMVILDEFVLGVIEGIKDCQLSVTQLNTIAQCMKAQLKLSKEQSIQSLPELKV